MTSHIQGSIKGLLLAVAAIMVTVTTFEVSAQTPPRGRVVRRAIVQPPPPVVVVDPCKRGGPGITPC